MDSLLEVSFDADSVSSKHTDWLASVNQRINLQELSPKPYWGFDDLTHKAGTKLPNCFYVKADVKRIEKIEHFHYKEIYVLQKFSPDKFIDNIGKGFLRIDFDARTGHNHGTKFRIKSDVLPELYESVTEV